MKGKQIRGPHKKIQGNYTSKPLDLFHMDFIGLMRTESKDGKKYILVVVDDFSRYSYIFFERKIWNYWAIEVILH